jgi:hypothetical protein
MTGKRRSMDVTLQHTSDAISGIASHSSFRSFLIAAASSDPNPSS